jgi:hypothetical protein
MLLASGIGASSVRHPAAGAGGSGAYTRSAKLTGLDYGCSRPGRRRTRPRPGIEPDEPPRPPGPKAATAAARLLSYYMNPSHQKIQTRRETVHSWVWLQL